MVSSSDMAASYFRRFSRACAGMAPLLERRDALRDPARARLLGAAAPRSAHPDGGMSARAEAIARIEARIGDELATIDEGLAVIEGIGKALGERYATVMFSRYYSGKQWRAVASDAGMSERWCRQAEAVCFGYVDSVGITGAIDGRALPSCGIE